MRSLIALLALLTLTAPARAQYRTDPLLDRNGANVTADFRMDLGEPLAHLIPADCDLDRTRGREAAGSHSGSGWMAGGFLSGLLLGLIGTAVTYAMASSSTVEVEHVPDDVEPSCYRDGYRSRARSTNTSSALTGGLLGTAVLVFLVISATSGSSY